MSEAVAAPLEATRRQRAMFSILACPTCRGSLTCAEAIASEGFVLDADLMCAQCGRVGIVSDGTPTFLPGQIEEPEVRRGICSAPLGCELTALDLQGGWAPLPRGLLATSVGAGLSGEVDGVGIALEVDSHEWSGRVIVCCGSTVRSIDLYSEVPQRRMLTVYAEGDGRHRWSATLVAGGNPSSRGDQMVLRDVRRLVPARRAPVVAPDPVNRGNPYPARFEAILRELPDAEIVVDIGGGDRRHADPRVLNMEYLPYEAVDFRGDGLALPIASDSVDLILSQAVLEHVPDPAVAVAEMRRVLKPGGRIFAEFAFMQPLHAVPFHFFNITPHGSALLFDSFHVIDTGVFGGLAETMTCFFRLLDARQRLGDDTADRLIADLARLDATLSNHELAQVASAVFVEADKPHAT